MKAYFQISLEYLGGGDFNKAMVPKYLAKGLLIYDVGGGKQPYLSVRQKNILHATVIGIDISKEELDKAPKYAYNRIICSAIKDVIGKCDGDLVICNAVLEHVISVENSLKSIYSLLKPGGIALLFMPSKNSMFAHLNMLLPEAVKKKLLFAIYPKKQGSGGFAAYYDRCTPKQISTMASGLGFSIIEERYYFWSSYFSFFFPLYVVWRIWVFIYYFFAGTEASEAFALALKKG